MNYYNNLVEKDLDQVNFLIKEIIEDQSHPFASMAGRLLSNPGKQLRPLLHLNCSAILDPGAAPTYGVAAAIELLHNASLAHDDVIDLADTRRGVCSINREYGNSKSILSGNWMYAEACTLLLKERNWQLLEVFFDTVRQMLNSEGKQLSVNHIENIKEEDILDRINGKTASLFTLCARSACILKDDHSETARALTTFAHNYGMAFQIADDLSDTGLPSDSTSAEDLLNGTLNLPMYYAWKDANSEKRSFIQQSLLKNGRSDSSIIELMELLSKPAVLSSCRSILNKYMHRASSCLDHLPDSDHKKGLETMLTNLESICGVLTSD